MSKMIYMPDTIKMMSDINKERTEGLLGSGKLIQGKNTYLVTDVVLDDIYEPIPTRTLVSGETTIELETALELKVVTKCPGKWILQDLETGQIYRGTNTTVPRRQWSEIKLGNNNKK